MATIRRKRVYYGSANSGLTTVGYQLYDRRNNALTSRRTTGVKELTDSSGQANGTYEARIPLTDYFEGELRWTMDENDTNPIVDYINLKNGG